MTFEDMRIIASSTDGQSYDCMFHDQITGDFRSLTITAKQLAMIFAFNMDSNGEPEGFEKFYEELEPLFVGWPNTVRPIP